MYSQRRLMSGYEFREAKKVPVSGRCACVLKDPPSLGVIPNHGLHLQCQGS
jgi:hypothetical protein